MGGEREICNLGPRWLEENWGGGALKKRKQNVSRLWEGSDQSKRRTNNKQLGVGEKSLDWEGEQKGERAKD